MNQTQNSKRGKLTPKEAMKSLRDASFMGIAVALPIIIETLINTDFGEYQIIATFLIAGMIPFANRLLRK